MLYRGDCKTELKKIQNNAVDLIYLDPPFFTQKKQRLKTRDNLKEYSFNDSWEDIDEYKRYMKERFVECKRVLKKTGSLFLHCDKFASHHLRVVLDDVFGVTNFQSEIVWIYKRWSNAKKGLLNSHQIIFFYSKTNKFKFVPIYTDYSPTTNIDQIFQKRVRDKEGKTVYKKNEQGGYELMENKQGVPLSDVWDIPYLNPKAKERVGYPTQKPINLLERIINLTTDEGDVVLDPFMGSGTTLVAAKLLKRKYIGVDISLDAVELAKNRLENPVKSESFVLKNGKESYLNQDSNILNILSKIEAVPVQRNNGIDGFLKDLNGFKPIPIKVQRSSETYESAKNSLLNACKNNSFEFKIFIQTKSPESALFDFSTLNEDNSLLIVDDINDFISNKEIYLNKYFQKS